jgi:Ca2+/Na+ antiporter
MFHCSLVQQPALLPYCCQQQVHQHPNSSNHTAAWCSSLPYCLTAVSSMCTNTQTHHTTLQPGAAACLTALLLSAAGAPTPRLIKPHCSLVQQPALLPYCCQQQVHQHPNSSNHTAAWCSSLPYCLTAVSSRCTNTQTHQTTLQPGAAACLTALLLSAAAAAAALKHHTLLQPCTQVSITT